MALLAGEPESGWTFAQMSCGASAVGGERLGRPLPGERLDHVGVLDALVIPVVAEAAVAGQLHLVVQDLGLRKTVGVRVGIPFGVNVLEDRAQRFAHGLGRLALGRDQDDLARLALGLEADQLVDVGVKGLEGRGEEIKHGVLLKIVARCILT